MKMTLIALGLIISSVSFADRIQVERSWKEMACNAVAKQYHVKHFDLEFCIDNSAVSANYERYLNQRVPVIFRGYLYSGSSINERCTGVASLDKSGFLTKIDDIVCDL
ncbi:MAG: hypothetical protein AB7I27_06670 [Bacteriovoracaceae bacterium]